MADKKRIQSFKKLLIKLQIFKKLAWNKVLQVRKMNVKKAK